MIAIAVFLFASTSTLAFYSSNIMIMTILSYVCACGFALTFLIKIENTVKLSLDVFFNIGVRDLSLLGHRKNTSPDEFVNICCADSKLSIPTREEIILKKKSALDVFNYYVPLTTAMIVFSIACFVFSFSALSQFPIPPVSISAAGFPLLALAFFGRKKSLQQEIAKTEFGFKEGPDWYLGFLEDRLSSSENAELLKGYVDGVRVQGRNLTNLEFALLSDFGESNGAFVGDMKSNHI